MLLPVQRHVAGHGLLDHGAKDRKGVFQAKAVSRTTPLLFISFHGMMRGVAWKKMSPVPGGFRENASASEPIASQSVKKVPEPWFQSFKSCPDSFLLNRCKYFLSRTVDGRNPASVFFCQISLANPEF